MWLDFGLITPWCTSWVLSWQILLMQSLRGPEAMTRRLVNLENWYVVDLACDNNSECRVEYFYFARIACTHPTYMPTAIRMA